MVIYLMTYDTQVQWTLVIVMVSWLKTGDHLCHVGRVTHSHHQQQPHIITTKRSKLIFQTGF